MCENDFHVISLVRNDVIMGIGVIDIDNHECMTLSIQTDWRINGQSLVENRGHPKWFENDFHVISRFRD